MFIKQLPNEINNIIFNMYWKDIFRSTISELLITNTLLHKINTFFDAHVSLLTSTSYENIKHDLKMLNDQLKSILENVGIKILCKYNYRSIYNLFDKDKFNRVLLSVKDDYKYICYYMIQHKPYIRYYILHNFTKL